MQFNVISYVFEMLVVFRNSNNFDVCCSKMAVQIYQ